MLLDLLLPPHFGTITAVGQKGAILIVDGQAVRRAATAACIKRGGFEGVVATSRQHALRLAGEREFDTAVVEDHDGDIDHVQFCARLKSCAASLLPVLHLSSRERRAAVADVCNADELIFRPCEDDVILSAVRRLNRLKRHDASGLGTSGATRLLQAALDSLPTHIALVTAEGRIVSVNRAWTQFAETNNCPIPANGRAPNYLEICEHATGASAEDGSRAAAGLRQVLAREVDQFTLDYAWKNDGTERWFHFDARRLDGMEDIAAIVTHSDVTAEYERAASDARYRTFVESAREGVVAMDTAGIITYANPRMQALVGFAESSLVGRSFYDALKVQFPGEFPFTRRDGESDSTEVRVTREDGTIVDLLVTDSPIHDAHGEVVGVLAMLTNVTARKRSESYTLAALRSADMDRRRLLATLEAIPVGVGLSDASGVLTHTNPSVDRIWRSHTSEPQDPRAMRAWWPKTGTPVAPDEWALSRTLASGEIITGEVMEIERLDGTHGYILNSSAPILDADGALTGALFVNVDVSAQQSEARERERLISSLETERTRLAAVFEQAPSFLALMRGADHVIERVNPAFEALIGHRSVIGRPLADALPELDNPEFMSILDNVRATGTPYVGRQIALLLQRTRDAAPETRYVDVVFQLLREADGNDLLVAHGVDVTATVQGLMDLRHNERRLAEQFAKLPVTTYLWEVAGDDFILIDFNEAAARAIPMFTRASIGTARSVIFGATPFDVVADLKRALRDNVVVCSSLRAPASEAGGSRLLELTVGPQQPNRLLVHAVDVTHRAELEEQLRRAQKLDALGRLAGGIAHDFNNLLGVMMSYTGMMLEDLPEGSTMGADLAEVNSAIERAAALTAQLLAFGRQQPLRPVFVDIRVVLRSSNKLIQRLIAEDIKVVLDLDGPEPLFVRVDVSQLEQVVMNLSLNARDAMPNGGTLYLSLARATVSKSMAAHVSVSAGDYVQFTVRDTGTGIDAVTIQRMFEPFFTTKEIGKGTGLGLATVYGIVNQSDGFIDVESDEGHGASFHVFLPIARDDAPRQTPIAPMHAIPAAQRRAVVLLVEDEERLRIVTERLMRTYGYEVIAVALPEDALRMITEENIAFDCVVSDVVMPGMSGQELAAQIRALRGAVPVLLLSGYARDAVERRGIVDEDIPLLHKPVRPADLARAIAELLNPPGEEPG